MRASMMQLERPGGDRTCIVINSLVAIATSNEAFNLSSAKLLRHTGSEVKTSEAGKSYKKKSGALNLKHRGAMGCGEKKRKRILYKAGLNEK